MTFINMHSAIAPLLPLCAVQNRDRQDIESIMQISNPAVRKVIQQKLMPKHFIKRSTFSLHVSQSHDYTCDIVQGIFEIFKADLKLIPTELLLSPKGRYKCPKQHTKSTKKSHWWKMPNFASKVA